MLQSIRNYWIAVLSVLCIFGLRWLADPLLGDYYPFHLFFISLVITICFTPLGPALLAMFLGAFLADYFFILPRYSLISFQPKYVIGLISYFFVSSVIIYFVHQTKEQKKQLQEKSVWLQRLINTSPDILLIYNVQEKRNVFVSKEIYTYLGYQPEEIIALGSQVFERVVHPDDLPHLLQIYHNMESRPDTEVNDSLNRLRHVDGSYRTFHVRRSVFSRGEDGRVKEIIATARDITNLQQTEEALRESQMHYHTLFTSIDEGFCIIEVLYDENEKPIDYRFLEVNPAFEKQTGLINAQGKRVRELIPKHEEHWYEIYGRVALTGQPVRFQNRAEHRWYDLYAFRYGEPEKRQVAVLFNDITKRKLTEETLHEADRRKDEFLAILGHELRNPIAAITSAVNLLNRPHLIPEKEAWIKEAMVEQTQQLCRIVDDLLDVSRIAQGKINLEMQTVPISDVVEKSLESVREDCQEMGHKLSVEGPIDQLSITGDPARLQQILVNLLNNACKYTPEGGDICLAVESENDEVVLRVTDNGIGIPTEAQSQIFEMFTQVESSKQRSQGGLGIGLSLVKMLTEMHGGSISVYSEGKDTGSEFQVRLPKRHLIAVPPSSVEPLPCEEVRGLQVLVVEDNLALAHMLVDTIEENGHFVQHTHDGFQALELARQQRPDVVLLDIGLPKMDGFEVARRLRNELGLSETLIIATTAWGQLRDRQLSAEAGIDHHLVKPVDYSRITPLMRQWYVQQVDAASSNEKNLDTETEIKANACTSEIPRIAINDISVQSQANFYQILLIEDSRMLAEMTRELLEEEGYRVEIAQDGKTGIAMAKQGQPDIILCDISLPGGVNGFEVAANLRQEESLTKPLLIALSASDDQEQIKKALASGFDAYLLKPLSIEELNAHIQNHVTAPEA